MRQWHETRPCLLEEDPAKSSYLISRGHGLLAGSIATVARGRAISGLRFPVFLGFFATARSSVSAVVVNIGKWPFLLGRSLFLDTIGTLPPLGIEIASLFSPVYCCVMGRKAPR